MRGTAFLQALGIAGTGAMLLVKVVGGTLPLYVHVRYTPLIAVTGALLILLAAVQLWLALRPGAAHDHDHTPLSWRSPAVLALLVPIVLGLVVPARALGSAAISARGFGTSGTGMRTVGSLADDVVLGVPDTAQWTMLDWVNGLIYEPDNPRLQGQPIELTGFVWRDETMPPDQFYLSRFIVSCCTADSLAIYLPVVWPETAGLAQDSWLRVRGTVALRQIDGQPVAVIEAAELEAVPQPAEPYLYP